MVIHRTDRNRYVASASKGEILAWCLYDWGNSAFATSVLAAVLPLYFAYIVPERGVRLGIPGGPGWNTQAASLWAYAVSLSLVLVAVSSPVLGTIADRTAAKKRFLGFYAFLGALCTALLFSVHHGEVWRCLILFMLANIGFAGANVFYNAFLPQMVGLHRLDRISGRGFAFGYLGGGLLLALNILMIQKPDLFGIPDRLTATRLCFVSVGIWWALFTVPILTLLHERPALTGGMLHRSVLAYGFSRVMRTISKATQFQQLLRFLIAYFIYNDGIQTVIVMATIFGRTELELGAGTLLGALLMVQIVAIPGALAFGRLAERLGAKKALMLSLIAWTGSVCYAFFMESAAEFMVIAALIGLILGGSQAISRSLYARFVPLAHSAEFYGFYAVSNKFAAIPGPFLFGLLADLTGKIRVSILLLALFFLTGLFLLATVDVEKGRQEALAAT
ncbi:MAG: MFS transporter [Syntrophobacteria bacterium]